MPKTRRLRKQTPIQDVKGDRERRRLKRALQSEEQMQAELEALEAKELQEKARKLMKQARERKRKQLEVEKHQRFVRSISKGLDVDPDRPITPIPPLAEGVTEVDFHVIKEGYSYIRISYDPGPNEYLYEVLEPPLDRTEEEARAFLRDTLVRTMGAREIKVGAGSRQYLEEMIVQAITDHSVILDDVATNRITYHLIRDLLGFGPLDVLMADPMIEDISCDGPEIPLYIFHRKYESIRSNVVFGSDLELDSFVIRLAQQSGKHISIADPMLDATLPDGSRLQATLAREVTTRGSSFTIRKFRADPLTPPALMSLGTMGPEMAAYFWFLMESGDSLIMAGGTASGKTTTLNAVCQYIPPEKKVVSIEDTREINLDHENWIAGVTRSGFGSENAAGRRGGTVDMYNLLEAALRQRPEYLLVGEVRGKEALTLFQAMATGHAVYSTMHADSVASAVYRLENPPINVPRMMLQTMDALAIQRQVRIGDRMTRRIAEVTEIVGFDPDTGDLLTNNVFTWDLVHDEFEYTGRSYVIDKYRSHHNLTAQQIQTEWENRIKVLTWLRDTNRLKLDQVAEIIHAYYRHPRQTLERIEWELALDAYPVGRLAQVFGGIENLNLISASVSWLLADDDQPGFGVPPTHGAAPDDGGQGSDGSDASSAEDGAGKGGANGAEKESTAAGRVQPFTGTPQPTKVTRTTEQDVAVPHTGATAPQGGASQDSDSEVARDEQGGERHAP